MQLIFEKSKESKKNTSGLSLIKGVCKKLKNNNNLQIRIPHIGWNSLTVMKETILLKNIKNNADFYFVHSYYVSPAELKNVIALCNYGIEFPAVVENNNIFGVQFHPEKCLKNGLSILKQFSLIN